MTLGVTGWKVGWVIAPSDLIRAIWLVHQFVVFSVATPLQEAAAISIEHAMNSDYFEKTRSIYESNRDQLMDTLQTAGFRPMKVYSILMIW